jgi:tRNA (guanosine-2'-O-)-methyltransferase
LRSAAVFGVERVYLVGATPGPEASKVQKTGLGTEHAVDTRRVGTLADVRSDLEPASCATIALELASDAVPIGTYDFPANVCLVIGNEGHGLPPAALTQCDAAVYVPQVGKVASLNVAAATSIALYEVRRQTWARSDQSD